jgi:hypothetical protein
VQQVGAAAVTVCSDDVDVQERAAAPEPVRRAVSTAVVELAIGRQIDVVPTLRRAVLEALDGRFPGLADDAALVVTELATNAVLHGRQPAVLRVLQGDDHLRVEVQDAGTDLPCSRVTARRR